MYLIVFVLSLLSGLVTMILSGAFGSTCTENRFEKEEKGEVSENNRKAAAILLALSFLMMLTTVTLAVLAGRISALL